SGSTIDPVISANATASVAIRNGQLQGGVYGIRVNSSSHLVVERLEIFGTHGAGIFSNPVLSVEVVGCHIHDVENDGIFMFSPSATGSQNFDARIVDNLIERTGGAAIFFEGMRSGEIRGNRISDWGSLGGLPPGITVQPVGPDTHCGGSLITGNTLSSTIGTSGIGIDVDCSRNLVTENVVRGAGNAGIRVIADENRIERNVASGNAGHGIQIGEPGFPAVANRVHLEGNQTTG